MRIGTLVILLGLHLAAGAAWAGPLPGGADTDGDTVEDAFDNCMAVANSSQGDADHNGCGDACQQDVGCDTNGDTAVGSTDFLTLRMNFGQTVAPPGSNGDCGDANGVVGSADFLALRMQFGNMSGPSGITTAQCDPSSCQCTPQ